MCTVLLTLLMMMVIVAKCLLQICDFLAASKAQTIMMIDLSSASFFLLSQISPFIILSALTTTTSEFYQFIMYSSFITFVSSFAGILFTLYKHFNFFVSASVCFPTLFPRKEIVKVL